MDTPNKGQPIDYSYLRRMADAITALETQSKSVATKSSLYNTSSKGNDDASPNELVIVTRYVTMKLNANNVATVFPPVTLGGKFVTNPVVTATPIATATTTDPEKCTISISSVSQDSVTLVGVSTDGKVRDIGVNIIAIGYKK